MSTQSPVTEEQLREMFERNFERLRVENGHSLAPDVREAAWDQVKLYWHKLRSIAESVTDTEVRLNLPNQKTPKGRTYCLEGIVDIVREADKVTMYDIKTHELAFVRENIDLYRDQLNVYAHIWRNLRGERLDETAIIATPVPDTVIQAMRAGDAEALEDALAAWNPVVPIDYDPSNVTKTIAEFADTVDRIEDGEFAPPPVATLGRKEGTQDAFASRVCRNCDLRFSCASYRSYARKYKDRNWRKFADFYDLAPNETESIDRLEILSSAEGAVALNEE